MEQALYKAVRNDNIADATKLLQSGADANSYSTDGKLTVLIEACSRGNKQMVDLLLTKGAIVNVAADGMTPLIAATLENDTDLVNMLLKKGADANQKDGFQRSAIHCAAQWGNNAIVANLLKQGTNVDIEDRSWKTPLYYATEYDFPECVQLLLSARADPLHKCKDESPLDVAMRKNLSTVAKMMKDALEEQRKRMQYELPQQRQQSLGAPSPPLCQRSISEPCYPNRASSDLPVSATKQKIQAASELPQTSSNTSSKVKEKMASITSPAEQDVTKELSVLQKKLDTKQKELADSSQLIEKNESKMHAAAAELDNVKAQNVALLRDLDEERRKVTTARKETLQLQIDLQRLQKEKDEAVQESQARIKELTTTNKQLDELLSSAEQSSLNIKERLQDSEGGLRIPSSDIKLTDMKLGHGSYGEVCIAYWQGCPVAVKMLYEVLASSPHNIDLLKQEVSVTWKLHHPNVAGVCGITLELDDKTKNAWIVMELLQGSMAGVIDESRREGVKPLSLREKVDMAYDSLCGLNYLQHLNPAVLHGDIRPTNILITTVMQAKLGDLGAARFSDASLSVGLVSPQYAATERLDGRSASKSKETDVYSMGVTLCELFTGIPPNREERLDQVQDIRERNIRYLCKLMVSDDPEKRPSTDQALADIGGIRKTSEYKACGPRRMVKGRLDGVENVRFADSMW